MTDARRAHWGRLIAATVAVIAGAFVLPHVVPKPDLQENRTLAPKPEWPSGPADLTAFRKATDAYVADHFPPRTQLIAAVNRLRMALGVSGSPKVVVGRDNWLFSDPGNQLGAARGDPPMDDAAARAWLEALAGRTSAMRAQGRAYVVLVPPVKETVYPAQTPGWFKLDLNRPAVTLTRLAAASGAGTVVYPHAPLEQQRRWGLHVYDRYDSHWTGLGAYQGYAAFMRSLQQQGRAEGPRPLESFAEIGEISPGGVPRDLALMLGVASFVSPNYPQFEDPSTAQSVRITHLDAKTDWTGLRLIETGQTGKPVLLITLDSFSNALMPFLYSHFSRIIAAHNQDGFWRPDLIERFQPDIVAMEVLENGLLVSMGEAPPPPPEARTRIAQAVEQRNRYVVRHTARYEGKRNMFGGGEDDDVLKGTDAPDDIQGRMGDDTINGLGGDDMLRGGRGRDSLDGGAGADWLSGGRDDDILRGGAGADIFNSFADAGTDTIVDFNAGEGDRVEIDLGVAYTVRQFGPDTVVEMQGAKLVLKGVKLADLPPGWVRNR